MLFYTRGHQHGARGHQVARKDQVDRPAERLMLYSANTTVEARDE